MRTPTGASTSTRLLTLTLLYAGLVAGTGCATLRATFSGYATGPGGIARPQQRLREALVEQDFAKALAWREDDALLQSLTTGVAAYYAKQFARSAAVLDTAALLADDRITASLSKTSLSLVTNDMARPYQPRRTERLFIPYYAMLSFVQLGAWEDAAVEARRIVALLQQYSEDRDDGERAVHGALQHLAGAVFERAGERNEAQVAYRAAQALTASLPAIIARDTASNEGEILLVVERGFVAHRTTETIELFLGDDDRDSLRRGGDGHHRVATRLAAQVSGEPGPTSPLVDGVGLGFGHHVEIPGRRRAHDHHDDDDDYHLTIAFPSLRRSARPWGGTPRVAVDSLPAGGLGVSVVVDDASAVDARRERVALATRAVARAVAKYSVTKAIKDKKGEVAGTIANFGASLLERADIRSWHLLPQELTLVRVRAAAGTRTVRVQMGEGWAVRSVDAGSVTVRRGELTIVPVRLWRDPAPSPFVAPPPVVIAGADSTCIEYACP
jgi:hypothetical protein